MKTTIGIVKRTATQRTGRPLNGAVRRRWRKGQPPKDGKTYEVRRRFRCSTDLKSRSPYAFHTAMWSPYAWWNGKAYVEKNQFIGGERWLVQPTEWRESPNSY